MEFILLQFWHYFIACNKQTENKHVKKTPTLFQIWAWGKQTTVYNTAVYMRVREKKESFSNKDEKQDI